VRTNKAIKTSLTPATIKIDVKTVAAAVGNRSEFIKASGFVLLHHIVWASPINKAIIIPSGSVVLL